MTLSDPADPSQPLLTFLRGVFGASVSYREPPTPLGRGFDTLIYRFRLKGEPARAPWDGPLVLRVYGGKDDEKARREASVQRYLARQEYPALEPLAVETSGGLLGAPFMIMPLIAGGTMLDRVAKRPWQAAGTFREMGRLHAGLHRLPHEAAPLRRDPQTSIDRFLSGVRLMLKASQLQGFDDALAWTEQHADAVRAESCSLLHGDFHPLNILIGEGGDQVVIDWSDAAIGDRHADVARTLTLIWFAKIVAERAVERVALRLARARMRRWYLQGYESVYPLEGRRLAFWEAAQALRGTIQIAEVHAGPQTGPHDLARRLPPGLIQEARAYFSAKSREFESLPAA